jgi:hypothetical protein
LDIRAFLDTEANVIPHTSILTWRWWGEDYYAQREEGSDTVYVTLYMDDPIRKWFGFSAQDLMKDIYDGYCVMILLIFFLFVILV